MTEIALVADLHGNWPATQAVEQDIKRRGIVCCGGTMMLDGLTETFRNTLSCPFFVTDEPIRTVPHGLYLLLSRMDDSD